jgi:magnesium chelatase family protein
VARRTLRAKGCFAPSAFAALRGHVDGGSLSGRGVDRVLRLARTIADLGAADEVEGIHVGSALAFRISSDEDEVAA